MSILSQAQATGRPVGKRIVIVAAEKMGKTTFTTGAPNALLIPLEQGYDGVQATAVPMLPTWAAVQQLQQEITQAAQKGQFPFKNVIIDSATAAEKLIHAHVLAMDKGAKSMEAAHGGYGKAYGVANNFFNDFLAWADMLAINANINMIFTAHSFSSKVKDPTAGEYDAWDILLHSPKDNKTYGKREIIAQWADVIGFLHEPVIVTEVNGVRQAVSRGQGRVLAVERTPQYVAGNRYGMRGTIPLPPPSQGNAWNHFAKALYDATQGRIDLFNREKP
jgi:hypothetical protein